MEKQISEMDLVDNYRAMTHPENRALWFIVSGISKELRMDDKELWTAIYNQYWQCNTYYSSIKLKNKLFN